MGRQATDLIVPLVPYRKDPIPAPSDAEEVAHSCPWQGWGTRLKHSAAGIGSSRESRSSVTYMPSGGPTLGGSSAVRDFKNSSRSVRC